MDLRLGKDQLQNVYRIRNVAQWWSGRIRVNREGRISSSIHLRRGWAGALSNRKEFDERNSILGKIEPV